MMIWAIWQILSSGILVPFLVQPEYRSLVTNSLMSSPIDPLYSVILTTISVVLFFLILPISRSLSEYPQNSEINHDAY